MSVNSVIGRLSVESQVTADYGHTILPNAYCRANRSQRRASHRGEISTPSRQLTDRPLQLLKLSDQRCPAIRDLVCRALGVKQTPVPRHLQRGAEHFSRYRLFGDAVLQRTLPAQAQAPCEQFLFVDVATRTEVHPFLGNHPVGVNERSEYEMSYQKVTFVQTPGGLFSIERCFPVMASSRHDRELIPQLVGELVAAGE